MVAAGAAARGMVIDTARTEVGGTVVDLARTAVGGTAVGDTVVGDTVVGGTVADKQPTLQRKANTGTRHEFTQIKREARQAIHMTEWLAPLSSRLISNQ